MSGYPDFELRGDLGTLALRLNYLAGQRAEIDVEIADLKAKLRSTLNVGQRGTINGQPVVSVSVNRRFDVELALVKLPADLVAMCMSTKFDPKQAKAVLPPAIYEGCMSPSGEPIVRSL